MSRKKREDMVWTPVPSSRSGPVLQVGEHERRDRDTPSRRNYNNEIAGAAGELGSAGKTSSLAKEKTGTQKRIYRTNNSTCPSENNGMTHAAALLDEKTPRDETNDLTNSSPAIADVGQNFDSPVNSTPSPRFTVHCIDYLNWVVLPLVLENYAQSLAAVIAAALPTPLPLLNGAGVTNLSEVGVRAPADKSNRPLSRKTTSPAEPTPCATASTVLRRVADGLFDPKTRKCIGDEVENDAWAITIIYLSYMSHLSQPYGQDTIMTLRSSLNAIYTYLTTRNTAPHHPRTATRPSGGHILDILNHATKVLQIVCDEENMEGITKITALQQQCASLLNDSHPTAGRQEIEMTASDFNQLQLAVSLENWGDAMATEMGQPVELWTETLVAKANLVNIPWFDDLVHDPVFMEHTETIVIARNQLFHGGSPSSPSQVYEAMAAVAETIVAVGPSDGYSARDFETPCLAAENVLITLTAAVNTDQLRLPLPSIHRGGQVTNIAESSLTPGARIFLHGVAQAGKTKLALQSVDSLRAHPSTTATVFTADGSTDTTFMRTLVESFVREMRDVVWASLYNLEAQFTAAKQHLKTKSGWILCVTKVTRGSLLLLDLLNVVHKDGRVIISGRDETLATLIAATRVVKVDPLTIAQKMAILTQLNAFGKKDLLLNPEETEATLKTRCTRHNAENCYTSPPLNETHHEKETRWIGIERRLLMHFARAPLQTLVQKRFLHETRAMIAAGMMLKSEPALLTVADLGHRYNESSQGVEVDSIGKNSHQDDMRIRLGLEVTPILDMLREAARNDDTDAYGALILLGTVAVCDRAETPLSLFDGGFLGLPDQASVERARAVCVRYALLRLPVCTNAETPNPDRIGTMDRDIHRFLKHALVAGSSLGKDLVPALRKQLLVKFNFSRDVSPEHWPALQRLAPSVSAWCSAALGGVEGRTPTKTPQPVTGTVDDTTLLSRLGELRLAADGDPAAAAVIFRRVLTARRRFLKLNDARVAATAYSLAVSYAADPARSVDAQKLLKEVGSMQRQALRSGTAAAKAAMAVEIATCDLGPLPMAVVPQNATFEEAVQLEKVAMELVKVHAKNQPTVVARAICRVGRRCAAANHHREALKHFQEALNLQQNALSRHNLQIAESFACIGASYAALKENRDSLLAWREAYSIREQWLSYGRQDMKDTLVFLLEAMKKVGKEHEARSLFQAALSRQLAHDANISPRPTSASSCASGSRSPVEEETPNGQPQAGTGVDKAKLVNPCTFCNVREDMHGDAGMCFSCGALFCGTCNRPDFIQAHPCPKCHTPLHTATKEAQVKMLRNLAENKKTGRHLAPTLHLLGNAYANGTGVEKDLEKAFDLYRQSAGLGSYEAIITLGVTHERGEGTAVDHQEAVRLYRLAAVQGNHRKAQFNLGNCYFVGRGVAQNKMIAFQWFLRSANQGYPEAQLCVGSCYERGAGVALNQAQAYAWFQKSAAQGCLKAQHSVACSLLHGLGVPQDLRLAADAFRLAADRGYAGSQFNLGVLLSKGRDDVEKNKPEAVTWFRKAADQDHVDALFHLGAAYSTGDGVPVDIDEAQRLFAKASEMGHALAAKYARVIQGTRTAGPAPAAADAPTAPVPDAPTPGLNAPAEVAEVADGDHHKPPSEDVIDEADSKTDESPADNVSDAREQLPMATDKVHNAECDSIEHGEADQLEQEESCWSSPPVKSRRSLLPSQSALKHLLFCFSFGPLIAYTVGHQVDICPEISSSGFQYCESLNGMFTLFAGLLWSIALCLFFLGTSFIVFGLGLVMNGAIGFNEGWPYACADITKRGAYPPIQTKI
eukprot:m.18742 g.18742  ORF g.18742 m.18742 type:complete len:1812 (-) comp5355_c0_seq2:111-5546(-)